MSIDFKVSGIIGVKVFLTFYESGWRGAGPVSGKSGKA